MAAPGVVVRRWTRERFANFAKDYTGGMEADLLREKYGITNIAAKAHRCRALGLLTELRVQGGAMASPARPPKPCARCGRLLTRDQMRRGQRYCSALCGRAWRRPRGVAR